MKPDRAKSSNLRINAEITVLVSVIVVAILLIPGIMIRLREMAKEQSCMGRLKVMGKATIAYVNDSDGWLPYPGLSWYNKAKIGGKMDAWIDSSISSKNVNAFQCPADKTAMKDRKNSANKLWSKLENGRGGWVALSYGINLVAAGVPRHPWLKAHRLTVIEDPAACFLIGDAKQRDVSSPSSFAFRHNKTANGVFADGHVAPIKKADIPKFKGGQEQAFWLGGDD